MDLETYAPTLAAIRREYRRTGRIPTQAELALLTETSPATIRRHLVAIDEAGLVIYLGHGQRVPDHWRLLVGHLPGSIEGAEAEGAGALASLRDALGGVDPLELRAAVEGAVKAALGKALKATGMELEARLALKMVLRKNVEPKCQREVWRAVEEIVDGAASPSGIVEEAAQRAGEVALAIFSDAAVDAARSLQ